MLHIGQEQQPILVIDNVVQDTSSSIDYAMTKNDVAPSVSHYPGLRSVALKYYGVMLKKTYLHCCVRFCI